MVILSKKFGKQELVTKYQVDEDQNGMRLDQYIQFFLTSFSRQKIKEKIKNGEIIIIGRDHKIKPSTKVFFKEIVISKINKTSHEDEYWQGKLLEIETTPEIIFEDNNIVVISKPPYMSAHPTGKHIFNCATVYFESIYNKTIHSIHRLDRETSGVMLLAKNPTSANDMTKHFEEDRVKKCYFFIAKIDNKTFSKKNEFEANERMGPMGAGLERVMNKCYPPDSKKGKQAKTYFRILHIENGYALGLAFPKTGRQHQIRLHALAHGLPLVGDKLYLGGYRMFQRFKDVTASKEDHELMELPRHTLHAMALNIPYQNEIKTFKGKLPKDLKEWIKNKTTINTNFLEIKLEKEITEYFTKDKK